MPNLIEPETKKLPWSLGSVTKTFNELQKSAFAYWVTLIAFAVLGLRFMFFINKWAVDTIYWDQWDFLDGFFSDKNLWQLFSRQHGPHRQGIGALLLRVIYAVTDWNMRAEAFVSLGIILGAAALFLDVKRKLTGRWHVTDAAIPLAALTLLQYEGFIGAQNPSHGPLPMLLVALIARILLLESMKLKATLLVFLSFLATYTGFGVFVGLIIPTILIVYTIKKRRTPDFFYLLGASIFSMAATASFFVDYVHYPAVACFVFPHTHPWQYFSFSALLFGRATGIIASPPKDVFTVNKWLMLTTSYSVLLAVGIGALVSFLRQHKRQQGHPEVILFLTSFTLIFSFFTAIGRVCLGYGGAFASRYVPYAVPGLCGIYIVLAGSGLKPIFKNVLLTLFLVVMLGKEFRMPREMELIHWYYQGKSKWSDCAAHGNTFETCNQQAGFLIHPDLIDSSQQKLEYIPKLEYLKSNGLSFYRPGRQDAFKPFE